MDKHAYVKISIGHPSLPTGQCAIVALNQDAVETIDELKQPAKQIVCNKLGIPVDEAAVFSFVYLGHDVLILTEKTQPANNPHSEDITDDRLNELKSLLRDYCSQSKRTGNCDPDTECEFCPMSKVYDKISEGVPVGHDD